MPAGWAAAAAAVGGALISADASRSAANKQTSAANAAQQTQLQMFDTVNSQNAPQRNAGYASLADLMYGLGLGPNPATSAPGGDYSGSLVDVSGGMPRPNATLYATDPAYQKAWDDTLAAHDQWIRSNNLGSPGYSRDSDSSWIDQQVRARLPATGTQPNTVTSSPSSTAGFQTGSNDVGGLFTHQFNASDLNANMAPNYAFVLDQGQRAARNAGNLQTGLISGNTMKGLEDYTQGLAGNQYQQAFQNFNTNQSNIFNRLATIAGFGPGANQTTANAGTNLAGNIGSAQLAGGAAQAAGTVGQANALSGGANNAASWYTLNQIMNKNNGGSVTVGDPGGVTEIGDPGAS